MSKIKTSENPDDRNCPYEFNEYLRRYTGFMNDNKEICAEVYLDVECLYYGCFPYSSFNQYMPSIKDGGKDHVYAIVNIDKNKVEDFYFNDISGIYRYVDEE